MSVTLLLPISCFCCLLPLSNGCMPITPADDSLATVTCPDVTFGAIGATPTQGVAQNSCTGSQTFSVLGSATPNTVVRTLTGGESVTCQCSDDANNLVGAVVVTPSGTTTVPGNTVPSAQTVYTIACDASTGTITGTSVGGFLPTTNDITRISCVA